jgi:predicted nucleotidyltransferase
MSNHINEILFALTDAGVEFIVGGGVAGVLHGVERVTLDVDIALNMDSVNVSKFLDVMTQLNLKPRVPVQPRDLMSPEAVGQMIEEKEALVFSFVDFDKPLRHVDVFLKKELSFEKLNADAHTVAVEGRAFKIIGIKTLLAVKRSIQPSRDKDVFDIKQLEKLLEQNEPKKEQN